jgi:hypothetical protein
MNFHERYILPVLAWSILAATAAAKSDLPSPEKRHESIDQAVALIQPATPAPLPANLKNPFVLSRDDNAGLSRKPVGDRQALEAVARIIIPSGVVQVGDSPMLLLGEKKLKVGEYLTITFAGNKYVVELTAISPSTFTLRLNKEEITQPINPNRP